MRACCIWNECCILLLPSLHFLFDTELGYRPRAGLVVIYAVSYFFDVPRCSFLFFKFELLPNRCQTVSCILYRVL